jgi:hypothetical protein
LNEWCWWFDDYIWIKSLEKILFQYPSNGRHDTAAADDDEMYDVMYDVMASNM